MLRSRGEKRRIEDDQGDRERPAKVLVNELDVNQELEVDCDTFVDEWTGETLDPWKVREVRAEEFQLMKNIPLSMRASPSAWRRWVSIPSPPGGLT